MPFWGIRFRFRIRIFNLFQRHPLTPLLPPQPSSLLSPCFPSCDSGHLTAACYCCDCSGSDVLPAGLSLTPITLPLISSPATTPSPLKAASLLSGALHLCLYSLSSMDVSCINSLKPSTAAIIPQALPPISFALYRIANAWNLPAEQSPRLSW